jgi:uncharacterized protein YecE (DUF72 family)
MARPFLSCQSGEQALAQYYSKVFDYVEIDSSFYRIPNQFLVNRWAKSTPDGFRFTTKFLRTVTHEKRLGDLAGDLEYFYKAMAPLEEKLLCLLIQLPPSMSKDEGLKKLRAFHFLHLSGCCCCSLCLLG